MVPAPSNYRYRRGPFSTNLQKKFRRPWYGQVCPQAQKGPDIVGAVAHFHFQGSTLRPPSGDFCLHWRLFSGTLRSRQVPTGAIRARDPEKSEKVPWASRPSGRRKLQQVRKQNGVKNNIFSTFSALFHNFFNLFRPLLLGTLTLSGFW